MKNVYITWHYTTHGVAYLKHILSKFYLLESLPSKIDFDQLDQDELNMTFENPQKNGFVFDKIVYLIAPQKSFDSLSSRRINLKESILDDNLVTDLGLKEVFKDLFSQKGIYEDIESELSYVKSRYPEKYSTFEQTIWRNIHHYSIDDQLKWLRKYSNFKNVYNGKLDVVDLMVNDLRNEKEISDRVFGWLRSESQMNDNIQITINVSLGSTETQVVWHILAEAGQLPAKTRFIKTYDNKSITPEKRFKQFSIKEIQTNLVSSIGSEFKLYRNTKSPSRSLANKKIRTFIDSGFSILLIGERGTGKSQIADKARNPEDLKGPFVSANCASFDEDSKAEAELFGYEKGAFTGAGSQKKGLLEEADNGVLFLDEIHHLSKLVQAKLMKALQTDKMNKMAIRRMGGIKEIKIECRLIFATNKSVPELRNILLPDFYDRIVQHVVYIPPLRETVEDRESDWQNVWSELRFKNNPSVPDEKDLLAWLNRLPLYGNYRDLQKIAIYYNIFNQFDDETRKMINETSAFQYARNEFEKYHSPIIQCVDEKFNFNINHTTREMVADYLFNLQQWAVDKYRTRKSAIEHFRSLGDTVTEKTFCNWKNKKP
jgi:transcriptional regulator with PAS, ATPase and Fis domain